MALIEINNLKLRAIIGTYPWERIHRQDIVINIRIQYCAKESIQSDNLEHTVDYHSLTALVVKTVNESKFHLLEKLADTLISKIINIGMVEKVVLRINKPFAIRQADSVSVELERTKNET